MTPEEEADVLLATISRVTGGMVTGFVLVAEFTDPEGERRIYGNTLNGQQSHSSLGLLGYGVAVETRRIQDCHFEDE